MAWSPALYAWNVRLRVSGDDITTENADALAAKLRHRFPARVAVQRGDFEVRVRILGHVGPVSAVGEAQQATTEEAVRLGIRNTRVDVVHAERVVASS